MTESEPSVIEPTIHYLDKQDVQDRFVKAIRDSECELEFIYGQYPKNDIQKSDFMRILHHLRERYESLGTSTTLDIQKTYVRVGKTHMSNVRCSIEGISDIQAYCKSNSLGSLDNVTYIRKVNYKDPQNPNSYKTLRNPDYNYRINLKSETVLTEDSQEVIRFKDGLKEALKSYRYKKRFSFVTKDRMFRFDVTAVKQTEYDYKTRKPMTYQSFKDAGILRKPEEYEVEIEYRGTHPINGLYPIDEYIKRVVRSDGKIKELYDNDLPLYNNIFSSDIDTVDTVRVDYRGYGIDLDDLGEFNDPSDFDAIREYSKRLFPETFTPIVSNPYDIHCSYWEDSDREWLLDILEETERTLTYERLEQNTIGSYKGAPKKPTTYAVFSVSPPLTSDDVSYSDVEAQAFVTQEFQQIYVPVAQITDTSESMQLPPIHPTFQAIMAIESEAMYDDTTLDISTQKGIETKRIRKNVIDQLVSLLDRYIGETLCCLANTDRIVTKGVREQIQTGYQQLTEQSGKKVKFVGPNPVPITLHELLPENPYTILHGFVATEKADGIRCQLYITKDKQAFLITQKMEIIDIGLKFPEISGEWLFDGEYITKNKNGDAIELFMIFDVYYASDGTSQKYPQHAYTYPWSSKTEMSRSQIIEEFKREMVTDGGTIVIGFKRYYEGPKSLKPSKKDPTIYQNLSEMGKICRKILKKNETSEGYGYEIDGIIFMPMYYPVASLNETPVQNISGPWSINYKWKEARENTIDFRLKFIKETYKGKKRDKLSSYINEKGESVLCKQVQLNVLYDRKRDPDFDYALEMLLNTKSPMIQEIAFQPPQTDLGFAICNIALKDQKMLCIKDSVEIQDGMIVEMRYCPEHPEGSQWVPLRHRFDKVAPQLFVHANNIWTTIQHPVTEEHILGQQLQDIPELVEAIPVVERETTYYTEKTESMRDESLRLFHNYVKSKLIGSICSVGTKSISILDTSVGRGGDIKKYLRSKNRVDFFLGLDISPDVKKAAKRFYLEHMRKPKAMFVQYDTGRSIKDGEGYEGTLTEIEKNKILCDIIYQRGKAIPKKYRPIVPKYNGIASKGFDVVSSQFSLHYYFRDEETLRGYIQNLADNCKKGGYYIGTCYDGMKVFQVLQTKPNHTLDMEDEFGNRVYAIIKKYEIADFTYRKDNKQELFGQEIDVYMNSIGQTITEYLVNFDMFVDIMKEYGFHLDTPKLMGRYSGIFDTTAMSYSKGFGGFEQILKNLEQRVSNDADLRNDYKGCIEIMSADNGSLRELSSLNNWFIFQKRE